MRIKIRKIKLHSWPGRLSLDLNKKEIGVGCSPLFSFFGLDIL